MNEDGRIIARAIFTLPAEVLAGWLAVLDEISLGALLKDKIGIEKFGQLIGERTRELSGLSESELAIRLLGTMNQICEVPPRRYTARRDFEDNAEEIVQNCVDFLRKNEKTFTGTDLQSMVRFIISKPIDQMVKKFDQLPEQKQQEILDSIRSFINQLPEEQQVKLRQEIGVDRITDGYLRRAILSGTLSTAFAAAVNIGGFPFYMGAASLLASLAGPIGLTLPFGAYTLLTSSIAVIANPLLFLPAILGGGIFLYKKQNPNIRRYMAATIVTQLAVAGSVADSVDNRTLRCDQALAEWQTAFADALQKKEMLEQTTARIKETGSKLAKTTASISEQESRKKSLRDERSQQQKAIGDLCKKYAKQIADGEWGTHLNDAGRTLVKEIENRQKIAIIPLREGMIINFIDRCARDKAISIAETNIINAAGSCAIEILKIHNMGEVVKNDNVTEILARVDKIDTIIASIDSRIAELRTSRSVIECDYRRLYELEAAQTHDKELAESKYWGIDRLL